jgi:hypothetical protein
MKKLLSLFVLMVLGIPAFGCDEACLRDRATVTNNVEFPNYLTWKFCEDTKQSFMQGDIASLENYRHQRLNTEHKNRMRNIQNFVVQRKEWLMECDKYMELTERGRIFRDETTTTKIFQAMDAVSTELASVLGGTTYTGEGTASSENAIIGGKFDHLFKLVDDHKTMLMLKGQFVSH